MAENLPALKQLLEAEKDNILIRLPKLNEWLTPEIWWSIVQQMEDGKLEQAAKENPRSIINAMCRLADWGLKPDGEEAFISVYKIKGVPTAQAQWMYKGGIRRAKEAGAIAHAAPDVIKEGDEIETYEDEKGRHLKHKRLFGKLGRKIVGSYCLFWMPDRLMDYELCDLDDIETSKKASIRVQGSESDAWKYGFGEMAKKTAVRRGLKRMQGKRDVGNAFASMMASETPFDRETTAEELPPDDLPTGEGEATIVVKPDSTAYISPADVEDLRIQFIAHVGNDSMLPTFLSALTNKRTRKLEELYPSEIPKFISEMQMGE